MVHLCYQCRTRSAAHECTTARQPASAKQIPAAGATAWRQPCLVCPGGGDVDDGGIPRRHVRQARLAHQERA